MIWFNSRTVMKMTLPLLPLLPWQTLLWVILTLQNQPLIGASNTPETIPYVRFLGDLIWFFFFTDLTILSIPWISSQENVFKVDFSIHLTPQTLCTIKQIRQSSSPYCHSIEKPMETTCGPCWIGSGNDSCRHKWGKYEMFEVLPILAAGKTNRAQVTYACWLIDWSLSIFMGSMPLNILNSKCISFELSWCLLPPDPPPPEQYQPPPPPTTLPVLWHLSKRKSLKRCEK